MKISIITPTIRPAGLETMQQSLMEQTLQDFEWLVEVGLPNKSDLNAANNRMARRAQGELLVFYQDCLAIKPDGLERFWNAYQMNKKAFFTGSVNHDWREKKTGLLTWLDWEIDWGACPRQALVDIGGFDETLDDFWGFDNVNAGLRADLAGYKIICIDNPAAGPGHPDAPMKKNRNPQYHNYRLDQIRQGLKMDYLTKA